MSLPPFLEDRVLPSRDPEEIRRALLEDLQEISGAQAGLFYKVGRREGESFLRAAAVLVTGRPEIVEHFSRIEGLPISDGGITLENQSEVDRLAPQWRSDMPDMVLDGFWDPVGVHSSLGMNVAREAQHVGFFGVLRAEPHPEFAKDAGSALGSRSLAYGDMLHAAEQLESAVRGSRALFVISGYSEVEFASEEARTLLAREGFEEALLAATKRLGERGDDRPEASWLGGASLQVYPVGGDGGLAHIAILDPMQSPPIFEVHQLSTTKRRIATLAASGATVAEIAETMRRSPETVRSHLSEIYARLGIGSRAELAVIVRDAWS